MRECIYVRIFNAATKACTAEAPGNFKHILRRVTLRVDDFFNFQIQLSEEQNAVVVRR